MCVGCAADLLAMTGLGLSTGVAAGYVHGANNGVWGDRIGGHLDPGPMIPVLLDTRAWMPIDRFRWGLSIQVGPTAALDDRLGPQLQGGAFEPGSRAGAATLVAYYAIAAYQPALSEHVQLWLGARLGAHHLTIPVEVDGRTYASVERLFISAGPELGVWIGEGVFGLMIQAFVDLAQPGVAQLVTSFAIEIPPNRGEAW